MAVGIKLFLKMVVNRTDSFMMPLLMYRYNMDAEQTLHGALKDILHSERNQRQATSNAEYEEHAL